MLVSSDVLTGSATGDFAAPVATASPSSSSCLGQDAKPRECTTRVLHVVNGQHFSGAERVQSHLGHCLPYFGVRADFAMLKPDRFAARLKEQDARGDSWGRGYPIPMTSKIDLGIVRRLSRLLRANEYQLVHAHTPRAAMVTALASRLAGVPWVYHVHSPASRDCERAINNQINAWVERLSLKNCSHQITVSRSLRNDLVSHGGDAGRITVVPNGVPVVDVPARSKPATCGTWVFGMIALMRARKGLEVALQAMAELRRRGRPVKLRCIGPFETDEYENTVESLIRDLGILDSVERIGFTDDVTGELTRMDAMVLPSLFGEGLPMVVLESMAAATPVIATRVEGTPEAIDHGVEGLLAEPNDPVSLADQMEALIQGTHDWSSMATAAQRRQRQCFSDLSMARQTASVYQKVMARL
ncbi:MAG: glycosyltransferase family 4 protein [Planctomycetota bacterium]